ncbi:MAG: ferrochelatase [Burkholderiaceae bacterium]
MIFRPEPAHAHGAPSRTGILVVNLGTPDAPTTPAVRRYLKEFLSDPRVVEIPRLVWWIILNAIILPFRSPRSAQKYALVWDSEGSPLKVWTDKQAKLLRGSLGARGHDVSVAYAMRYGNPSIASVLDQLHAEGCDRILVLSMYPQYSAATTASTFDAVHAWCAATRNVPAFRFVRSFHDDAGYIDALAKHVTAFRMKEASALEPHRKLVMSFHGVPKRSLLMGDPYHCQCRMTARLVAERLGMRAEDWVVSFQSRFGKAEWLQPYTNATLAGLAKSSGAGIDVFCPGFPADCLETLEEIAMEGRQTYIEAGGRDYRYIPCLNDAPAWIDALATLAETHLQGWPTRAEDPEALRRSRLLAMELGAAA